MKRRNSFTLRLTVALATTMLAAIGNAKWLANSPNLPPMGSSYLGFFHAVYPQGVLMRNPIHRQFTSNMAPPTGFGTNTHSFGSMTDFDISVDGGQTWLPQSAPANTTVRVTHTGDSGPQHFFDTEMLQLDISGGTLPAGVMVRESPTRASLGQTRITDLGGGQYHIDSFFDVFTDLSLDGGQTWGPSNDSGRMNLVPEPASIVALGLFATGLIRRRKK